ncbi:MAG: 16S rRNA (cytosine(967)-C(5))-methyltransferase RsmB [Peptostreptococcales bacterium]
MNNDRWIALEILKEIEEKDAYSNITINKFIQHYKLEEAAFIRELVYGVIENKIYLDYIIQKLVKSGFNKLKIEIKLILELGIYQLAFLTKTPDYAVIDESVKLVKKYSYRHAGFVNGVLRNYIRQRDTIKLPRKEENLIEYLSVKYSYPKWIIEEFFNQYHVEFTESLLRSLNTTPALTVRINTLKTDKNTLIKELRARNIEAHPCGYTEDGLVLKGSNIIGNDLFEKGYYQAQDESSMIAIKALNPKPGETIIDVCAAPGGKTLYMAELMRNKGLILARDIHEHKLKLLTDRAAIHGIGIVHAEVFDSLRTDVSMKEQADKVLVDAPCSGFGVIRRKPEIKYNRDKKDISHFANMQYNILCQASPYVKEGGVLMYTTCTLLLEENDDIIAKFLDTHGDFEIEPLYMHKEDKDLPDEKKIYNVSGQNRRMPGTVQLYPDIHHTDGFYICKMRKTNNHKGGRLC